MNEQALESIQIRRSAYIGDDATGLQAFFQHTAQKLLKLLEDIRSTP